MQSAHRGMLLVLRQATRLQDPMSADQVTMLVETKEGDQRQGGLKGWPVLEGGVLEAPLPPITGLIGV